MSKNVVSGQVKITFFLTSSCTLLFIGFFAFILLLFIYLKQKYWQFQEDRDNLLTARRAQKKELTKIIILLVAKVCFTCFLFNTELINLSGWLVHTKLLCNTSIDCIVASYTYNSEYPTKNLKTFLISNKMIRDSSTDSRGKSEVWTPD